MQMLEFLGIWAKIERKKRRSQSLQLLCRWKQKDKGQLTWERNDGNCELEKGQAWAQGKIIGILRGMHHTEQALGGNVFTSSWFFLRLFLNSSYLIVSNMNNGVLCLWD